MEKEFAAKRPGAAQPQPKEDLPQRKGKKSKSSKEPRKDITL